MKNAMVYLIPVVIGEDRFETIPSYVRDAISHCDCFFAENERIARRLLKRYWKEMIPENYRWYSIHKMEKDAGPEFLRELQNGNNVGIVSDAGCPGIADPGQMLIELAQRNEITVKPLVGPSSLLMALMASGMNGQRFQFWGYLPIDTMARKSSIRELELDSAKRNCSEIFIETPYRNNKMLEDLIHICQENTRICVAVDISLPSESIRTLTAHQWKAHLPDLKKRPAVFIIKAEAKK